MFRKDGSITMIKLANVSFLSSKAVLSMNLVMQAKMKGKVKKLVLEAFYQEKRHFNAWIEKQYTKRRRHLKRATTIKSKCKRNLIRS